jgi:hypothetical protein
VLRLLAQHPGFRPHLNHPAATPSRPAASSSPRLSCGWSTAAPTRSRLSSCPSCCRQGLPKSSFFLPLPAASCWLIGKACCSLPSSGQLAWHTLYAWIDAGVAELLSSLLVAQPHAPTPHTTPAGAAEPGAPSARAGAAGAVLGHGRMGGGSGTVGWVGPGRGRLPLAGGRVGGMAGTLRGWVGLNLALSGGWGFVGRQSCGCCEERKSAEQSLSRVRFVVFFEASKRGSNLTRS